ncbi:MAG TPA: sialidase family protein [Streptosporangiaceae bacterium]
MLLTLPADQSWFRVELRSPGSLPGIDSDPTLPDQLRGATSPVFISVREPAEPQPEIQLPAADSGRDGASLLIGDQAGFAGFADVAVSGGVSHVVAEVHAEHQARVAYLRADGHGNGQGPQVLSGASGTARSPRVAASGRDVWVVWQDELGQEQPHRPSIFLRHSSNGGHSFGPAVQLSDSTGTGLAIHPAIALLDAGHPVVSWADNSAGAFDVFALVVGIDQAPVNISAAGKVIDPGNRAADARSPRFPASLFPSVTVTGDRRIVVAWQDDRFDADPLWTGHTPPPGQPASGGTDPDNWQILASSRPAGAAGWGPAVQVSVVTDAADRHPSIVADSSGTLIASWDSKALQSSGANLSLRSSHSADGGATWSPFEQVAFDADAMSQRARLSRDGDGAVRAVWYDSRSADWRWKVFTARRDQQAGWGSPQQLTTLGNGTFPAADGGVVVFTSDRGAARTQRDATQQVFLTRIR